MKKTIHQLLFLSVWLIIHLVKDILMQFKNILLYIFSWSHWLWFSGKCGRYQGEAMKIQSEADVGVRYIMKNTKLGRRWGAVMKINVCPWPVSFVKPINNLIYGKTEGMPLHTGANTCITSMKKKDHLDAIAPASHPWQKRPFGCHWSASYKQKYTLYWVWLSAFKQTLTNNHHVL